MSKTTRILEENMKSFSKLALSLTIAAFLLTGPAAKADTLTITLDSPFQSGLAGQTLNFSGTITNPLGPTVALSGDSITLAGTFTTDDTGFLFYAPLTLSASQSSGDIPLFAITIDPGTALGIYAGAFDILDGSGAVEGQADFDIDVTPEPGTILLLGTGLLVLAGMIRWRLPKPETMTAA